MHVLVDSLYVLVLLILYMSAYFMQIFSHESLSMSSSSLLEFWAPALEPVRQPAMRLILSPLSLPSSPFPVWRVFELSFLHWILAYAAIFTRSRKAPGFWQKKKTSATASGLSDCCIIIQLAK